MDDPLGRTLEHRIIILERRLDNVDETQKIIYDARLEWLHNHPEEEGEFFRALLRKFQDATVAMAQKP
jgi:hypothetical protein